MNGLTLRDVVFVGSNSNKNVLSNSDNNENSDITDGLVGWWKTFNETTATDSSGNGNGGTLNGGVTITTGPNGGQGILLNGSDGYVAMTNNNNSLNIANGGSLTITAWVKTTDTVGTIVSLRNSSNSVIFQAAVGYNIFVTNNGHFLSYMRFDDDGSFVYTPDGGLMNDDEWHFITLILNQTTNVFKSYLDASNLSSAAQTSDGTLTPGDGIRIGTDTSAFSVSQRFLAATVADVRFYNRELAADELSTLYTNGAK